MEKYKSIYDVIKYSHDNQDNQNNQDNEQSEGYKKMVKKYTGCDLDKDYDDEMRLCVKIHKTLLINDNISNLENFKNFVKEHISSNLEKQLCSIETPVDHIVDIYDRNNIIFHLNCHFLKKLTFIHIYDSATCFNQLDAIFNNQLINKYVSLRNIIFDNINLSDSKSLVDDLTFIIHIIKGHFSKYRFFERKNITDNYKGKNCATILISFNVDNEIKNKLLHLTEIYHNKECNFDNVFTICDLVIIIK
jgi:hypothetical protein